MRRAPFVAREPQRADLGRAIAHARDGRCGAVLVHGAAGMGKSRLVREVTQSEDVTLLWGSAHLLDRDLAYAPVVEALTGYLDRQTPLLQHDLTDGLEPLGAILDGYGLAPPPTVDPAVDRTRRAEAVRRLLGRVAARGPTVLVVDDVHWADAATVGVLQRLTRDPERHPLLVVLTYRPDELEGDGRHLVGGLRRVPTTVEIAMTPLGEAPAHRILRAWAGDRLPVEDADELVARAAGNPLFLEALARTWVAAGRVPDEPPDVVADLLLARLRGTSRTVREVLDALAVAGVATSSGTLADVTGLAAVTVEQAIARLAELGLVEGPDGAGRVGIAHPLVLEAAHEAVSPLRRQRLHAAYVEHLGPDAQVELGVLARHHREAGPHVAPGTAMEVLMRAGERAVALLAGREAVQHLTAALDLARDHAPGRLPRLLELLALGWYAQGEVAAAVAVAEQALPAARQVGAADVEARCHQLLAVIHWYANQPSEARAALDRAGQLAEAHDDPVTRAALLLREAHLAHVADDRVSLAAAVEALARLAQLRDVAVASKAWRLAAGWEAQLRWDLTAALGNADASLAVPPDPEVTAPALQALEHRAHTLRAQVHAELGDVVAARRDVAAGLATAPSVVAGWRTHVAALTVACEAEDTATIDRRLADARAALLAGTRAETPEVVATIEAWAALSREDVRGARAAAERALSGPDAPVFASGWDPLASDLLAALAVAERTPPPASVALPPAPALGLGPWGHEARLLLAVDGHEVGDVERLRRELARMGPPGSLPDLMLRRVAALAEAARDAATAGAALHAVAEEASARGLVRRAARTWAEAAELLRDDLAVDAGRRALELAERLGAPVTADRARRVLRRHGVRVARPSAGGGPLTTRQREVAALVADGLSNAEIAARLFISVRTVTTHLDNTYTALGIGSRAQLASWWVSRGRDT